MAIRRIILVRHGQYHLDRDAESYGSLTALGRRQAKRVATLLKSMPVTRLYSSDLPRARESATIIREALPGVGLHVTRRLRECFPGIPLNWLRDTCVDESDTRLLGRLQASKRFRQRCSVEIAGRAKIDPDELEAGTRAADRVFAEFFKPARGTDKLEVLVCHGNLIRALFCRTMRIPPEYWLSMMPLHCGITTIEIAQRIRLLSLNESQHLPQAMRSEQ